MAEEPLVAVLAAGQASRFGGGKLDADLAGKPVGQWVIDAVAAAGRAPGVVVTGPEAPGFARESGWAMLPNGRADEGMGTSVAAAAREAMRQGASALLVVLADMPLVDPAHIAALAAAKAPAATRYPDGRIGVPALFGCDLFPVLAALDGEQGAAAVLRGLGGVALLDPPEGMLADVDRPEDLARLTARLSRQITG